MNRRRVLTLIGANSLFAGCGGREDTEDAPAGTTSPTPRDTLTETPATQDAEGYLPEPAGGWKLDGTSDHGPGWQPLGVEDGTIGHYIDPHGETYDVVVMLSKVNPVGQAQSLACAGWQVAFAFEDEETAIAASSGTPEQTHTPEVPPTMTETPASGTEDRVRELLALSPAINESNIDENRVDCDG